MQRDVTKPSVTALFIFEAECAPKIVVSRGAACVHASLSWFEVWCN